MDQSIHEYTQRLLNRSKSKTPEQLSKSIRRRQSIIDAIKGVDATPQSSVARKSLVNQIPESSVEKSPTLSKSFVSRKSFFVNNYEPKKIELESTKPSDAATSSKSQFVPSNLSNPGSSNNVNQSFNTSSTLQSFSADAYSAEFEMTDEDLIYSRIQMSEIQKKILPASFRKFCQSTEHFKNRYLSDSQTESPKFSLPDVVSGSKQDISARLYPDLSTDLEEIEKISGNIVSSITRKTKAAMKMNPDLTMETNGTIVNETQDVLSTNESVTPQNLTVDPLVMEDSSYMHGSNDIEEWQKDTPLFFNKTKDLFKIEKKVNWHRDQSLEIGRESNNFLSETTENSCNNTLVQTINAIPFEVETFLENALGDALDNTSITYDRERTYSQLNASELMSEIGTLTRNRNGSHSRRNQDRIKENSENENDYEVIQNPKPDKNQSKHTNTLRKTITVCRTLSNRLKKKFRKNLNHDVIPQSSPPDVIAKQVNPDLKESVKKLLEQVDIQQTLIYQANKALNLCSSLREFSGSTEHVESERLLLLATLRKRSCLDEIRRLANLGDGCHEKIFRERAEICVQDINLILDESTIYHVVPKNVREWFMIVIQQGLKIWASQPMYYIPENSTIDFAGCCSFPDLNPEFKLKIQVYTLKLGQMEYRHEEKYHIKQNEVPKRWTLKPSRFIRTSKRNDIKKSDIFCFALKEPSFILGGEVECQLKDIKKKTPWKLHNVDEDSILKGMIDFKLECKLRLSVSHCGFLNFGEEAGGYIAWNRRWCSLAGRFLYFWNYPREQEAGKLPVCKLDLIYCVSPQIEQVERTRCPRPRTLLYEMVRKRTSKDRDTTLTECRSTCTIIRYLLSFDTNQDMMEWQSKMNHIISALREWRVAEIELNREVSDL